MRAADLVAELDALRDEAELAKVRRRLAAEEPAFGVRMGSLFDVAKRYAGLGLDEVGVLLDHDAYEPRMAAFCVLDFQARKHLTDEERRDRCQLYLDRHDRITTWDMVDRSAPRVVGGHLAGRDKAPLRELATAAEPLRRRTAITAPLAYVRGGADGDLADGFDIAELLAADPDPVVHNAVGIFLKHAGTREPARLRAFLDAHAPTMPRPGLRLATEKLPDDERAAYRG